MAATRAHLNITGRVQGFWYRASTQAKAEELGLTGWVRNCADGSVELAAEGERAVLVALIAWAHDGPPGARVQAVDVRWEAAAGGFAGFNVRN